MTPEETTQVAEAVDLASRYVSITEQIRIGRGEFDADKLLTREWRRIGRIMREVLGQPGRVVAANSAVTHYTTVYNGLCIVRREAKRSVPADHRSRASR